MSAFVCYPCLIFDCDAITANGREIRYRDQIGFGSGNSCAFAKETRYLLFIVIELALMATDLAEVIGSGIALHLLFGWSLLFDFLSRF